jgi:hypothetical protein
MARDILDKKPEPLSLQAELHATPPVFFNPAVIDRQSLSNGVATGNIRVHAEGRLAQSYGALELIQGARDLGRIPEGATFAVVRAHVQDKQGMTEFPAAHRLPGEIVMKMDGQPDKRLSELYEAPEHARWIDRNISAPTDVMHRLANVADRWMESGGMIQTLDKAVNAVAKGELSAKEAFHGIVEPGYEKAIHNAAEKLDRNLAMLERKPVAIAVAKAYGSDLKPDGPLQLKSQDITAKTAVREMMNEVIKGYAQHTRLPAAQQSDMLHKTRHLAIKERVQQDIQTGQSMLRTESLSQGIRR